MLRLQLVRIRQLNALQRGHASFGLVTGAQVMEKVLRREVVECAVVCLCWHLRV